MARLSLKMLAATAAVGIGSILGAGAASAAPAVSSPIIVQHGSSTSLPLVDVQYRYGHRPYRVCTPGQAASKASRMGIRNPRVVVNRNVVRVSGWKRGLRTAVVFARAPGCPIIR